MCSVCRIYYIILKWLLINNEYLTLYYLTNLTIYIYIYLYIYYVLNVYN